jgi:branched-chain amino acid transport system substrate-binding protein
MKRSAVLLLVLCVAVALAFIALNERSITSAPVKLGAILPLTGPGEPYGTSLRRGIDLAIGEYNKGRQQGQPEISVLYEDSKGEPKTASTAFFKLKSVDLAPLVFASVSGVVLSLGPLAEREKVVLLNISATSPKICEADNKYVFSAIPDGGKESVFLAQSVAGMGNDKRVGVLFVNNAAGVDLMTRFSKELETKGRQLAISESYDVGSLDYRVQLTKFKAARVEIGYLIMFGNREVVAALTQARELGLVTTWISYAGVESDYLLQQGGAAADGLRYSFPRFPDPGRIDAFRATYGQAHAGSPDVYAITAYDAATLVANIVARGARTPDDVRAGMLSAATATGVAGSMAFDDRQCTSRSFEMKTLKDGRYQSIQN